MPRKMPSGNNKTQVDYILIGRLLFTTVTDCKIIPYETVAPQHRPLIAVQQTTPPIKQREECIGPRREKKRLYHKFLDNKTLAKWQIYTNANRESSRCHLSEPL